MPESYKLSESFIMIKMIRIKISENMNQSVKVDQYRVQKVHQYGYVYCSMCMFVCQTGTFPNPVYCILYTLLYVVCRGCTNITSILLYSTLAAPTGVTTTFMWEWIQQSCHPTSWCRLLSSAEINFS